MSKTKEELQMNKPKDCEESKIFIDVPIMDIIEEYPSSKAIEDSYDEALRKIKSIKPDFNENLFIFEYEFICRVNINPIPKINDTKSSSNGMPDNKS